MRSSGDRYCDRRELAMEISYQSPGGAAMSSNASVKRSTRDQRIEVEGGLAIDFARRAVYRDGREVHLTPIEFSLLDVLLRERGGLHAHASLLRQVWGPGHVHDAQLLRTQIANLRRKLASPHIRTLHGVGYRFEEAHTRLAVIPGQARSPTRVPDLRAA